MKHTCNRTDIVQISQSAVSRLRTKLLAIGTATTRSDEKPRLVSASRFDSVLTQIVYVLNGEEHCCTLPLDDPIVVPWAFETHTLALDRSILSFRFNLLYPTFGDLYQNKPELETHGLLVSVSSPIARHHRATLEQTLTRFADESDSNPFVSLSSRAIAVLDLTQCGNFIASKTCGQPDLLLDGDDAEFIGAVISRARRVASAFDAVKLNVNEILSVLESVASPPVLHPRNK
ncbi:hypothetical protein HZC07_00485 [Candidatus Micrarchaeota archaeon]|nr:hypothetical protein [Candidatus Micrarchaeota archaeon]